MTELVIHPDADALAADIARRLEAAVVDVQEAGRTPQIVLTGGTIAVAAYEQLSASAADWSNVDWWFGDERYVPVGHHDRNDQQVKDAFLDRVGVRPDRIHSMPAHGCDVSMSQAADQYGTELPSEPFDVVLLGMGPDGHVASLFPGFDQLRVTDRLCVEVFGSPKPPPERITLTFPALNNTREAWFLVSGAGKAEAVARANSGATVETTPAAGVQGLERTLWLLDRAAASGLDNCAASGLGD